MPKVLITDGLDEEGIQILEKGGMEVINRKMTADELLKEISSFDALIVRSATKVTREVIERADNLKIIGRAGVGFDNIDINAASEKGIVVKNAPSGSTNADAEHTIGLMIALSRKTHPAYLSLREGIWKKKEYEGVELYGKKLGIIGCGRIGKRVANIARHGFEMNVIGYDLYHDTTSGITYVTMDELLGESDYVTLHTPKLEKPIIGENELRKMKPTAYLINTSRGGNVDEKALYKALKERWIAGAALDVYQKEAKDNEEFVNELFKLDNFIGTPHLGASTREAQRKTSIEIADVILSYLKDADWANAVNVGKEIGEKRPTSNVFITHDDKPGMFAKISDIFGKYGINIGEIPSREIGYGKAITVIKAQADPSPALINELRGLDGVYRVTY